MIKNVFVLNTGRCGSLTFSKACSHIINYTSSHESLTGELGNNRFNYPNFHIEVDNRLSWLLGKLDKYFGNDAFYVHLKRDKFLTAKSFEKRAGKGIMKAYEGDGILMGSNEKDKFKIALDYVETVNLNISLFLNNKSNKMDINIENPFEDFILFCNKINAVGDLDKSLKEFQTNHNKS